MIFTNRHDSCDPSIGLHLSNQPLQSRESCLFLGVYLDNRLKFNLHIKYISEKISKSIGIMFKLSKIFPASIMKSLYFSFVYSYLVYCNCVWGGTFPTHLAGLNVLHKRVIRLISNSAYLAHTNNIFYRLNLLKLPEIHELRIIMYVYLNFDTFSTFDTSTRGSGNLRPEFQRLRLCQNSIRYFGPKCWNNLPADLKFIERSENFKNKVKKHLIARYSEDF